MQFQNPGKRIEMYFVTKLFNWNFIAWRRFGYLDRKKRTFILVGAAIVPCIEIILITFGFFTNRRNFDEIIQDGFYTVLTLTGILRAIVVLQKQEKFLDLLNDIENWYTGWKVNDETALIKLEKLTKQVRFLSKSGLRFLVSVNTLVALQPLLTSYGSLLAEFDIPGIDIHKSPMFELTYIIQACWMAPVIACSYVCFSNFHMIFIYFGIFVLRDLQQKIKETSKMAEKEAMESIRQCIVYHLKIFKYRDDLEDIFAGMSLLDVSLYCGALCGMLIYTTMDFSYILLLKSSLVLLIVTLQIFLTYYLADIFTQESLRVAEAAYHTNWIDCGKDFRRCILFIIQRSQRPLNFTAGNFRLMNLNTFLGIMRASYSVFSLLQSTM